MPLTTKAMAEELVQEVLKAAKRHDIGVHIVERWPIAAMNAFLEACEQIEELKGERERRYR